MENDYLFCDSLNFLKNIQNLNIEDKVIFTGMVSPKVVALYYQAGDIFVNFSTTETQGLTYIEALASGVPLLVKYDDNLEDVIINGQNGYSFTDDNEFIPLFNKMTSNRLVFDELTNNTTKTIIITVIIFIIATVSPKLFNENIIAKK